jgi:predicted metallopeptidase
MRRNLSWHVELEDVSVKVKRSLVTHAGCDYMDTITCFVVRSKSSSAQADDTNLAVFVERCGSTPDLCIGLG